MKKFLALILSVIYLTASSGVILHVHYCKGKLSSVTVQNLKDNLCKCGMKAEKSTCCHSEIKIVKLNNVHKESVANYTFNFPLAVVSNSISLIDLSKTYSSDIQKSLTSGPNLNLSYKIYLQNQVFRI